MFYYCKGITSLDLSCFNTSKVTNMSEMFLLTSLTNLNISSFNTSNVTDMNNMFSSTKFVSLDLRHFNTNSQLKTLKDFLQLSSLQTRYLETILISECEYSKCIDFIRNLKFKMFYQLYYIDKSGMR